MLPNSALSFYIASGVWCFGEEVMRGVPTGWGQARACEGAVGVLNVFFSVGTRVGSVFYIRLFLCLLSLACRATPASFPRVF